MSGGRYGWWITGAVALAAVVAYGLWRGAGDGHAPRLPPATGTIRLFADRQSLRVVGFSERRCLEVALSSQVSEQVTVPAEALLTFAYGMTPQAAATMEGPVDVQVSLATGAGSVALFSERWLPHVDRRRTVGNDVVVDLGAWAGQTVDIRFRAAGPGDRPLRPDDPAPAARGFFWASPLLVTRRSAQHKPNIVLIGIDSLRADRLGCYGYERDTSPAIDALAARGLRFERAISQGNWTLPSFASVHTGLYPFHHGLLGDEDRLPAATPSFANVLRERGYLAAGFHGGVYLGSNFGYAEHYDLYRKIGGFRSLPLVTRWLERLDGVPFFLWLHTYDVHAPYGTVPLEYRRRYTDPDYDDLLDLAGNKPSDVRWKTLGAGHPSDADIAYLSDLYDGEIRFVDDRLSEFFAWLERSGHGQDTYVLLVSDHGQEFGEHQRLEHRNGHLYDELLHVPMILAGPGIPRGRTVPSLVETVDLLPTLLELLGMGAPSAALSLDGRSLTGLFDGASARPSPGLRLGFSLQTEELFSVRTAEWSLIHRQGDRRELHDLREDPGEHVDVLAKYPEMAERLGRAYRAAVQARAREATLHQPLTEEVRRELEAMGYL